MLLLEKEHFNLNLENTTPMLKQYFEIKSSYPDCILFYRVGDFYETYAQDAEISSKTLEIVLTSRDAGGGKKIFMAGVPYHAASQYIYSLVQNGYKVAICEQMENPKLVKGIVKREVVRVITSGTILEPSILESKKNNYLIALTFDKNIFGLAVADISTSEFKVAQFLDRDIDNLIEEIKKINPTEVILQEEIKNYSQIINLFSEFLKITVTFLNNKEFQVKDLQKISLLDETFLKEINLNNLQLNFNHSSASINSALLIIKYLKITQKNEKISFNEINFFNPSNYLILDFSSQRNLELFQTILGAKKEGSLLWVLDYTITSMGGRLLRSFLERPLINKEQILLRQNAVKTLTESYSKVEKLRILFNKINDLERIASKIEYAACNARDLLALKNSLEKLPQIKEELKNFDDLKLKELYLNLNPLEDIYQLIHKSIAENPPISLREGSLIKNNFNPDLDDLRNIKYQAKEWIASLENQEKIKTGIKSLKIGFNQVFGYYIEITKPNLPLAPSTYIRKQTIANGERFINQELKDYEAQVLGAEEKIKNLEYEIFTQIREEIFKALFKIRKTAKTLAYLDVFLNFAYLAVNNNYIQPIINEEEKIIIKNGRHPVAEKILKENFIPNDINLNEEEKFLIITGPNMAGKSTYLRQIALIAIMAQMGSFVPAEFSQIGIVDRIFTRVGASDDLHLGQSTFMLEMIETANITKYSTSKSLIILDEIGRGTNTQEGLSIAWAVAEYLHDKIKAKTLFATHFYELTKLPEILKNAKNYQIAVKECQDKVIFSHKIIPGKSKSSFALYVAHLAGLNKEIIKRAEIILKEKEIENFKKTSLKDDPPDQITFREFKGKHPLSDEILSLSLDEITPIEALKKIYRWQKNLRAEKL